MIVGRYVNFDSQNVWKTKPEATAVLCHSPSHGSESASPAHLDITDSEYGVQSNLSRKMLRIAGFSQKAKPFRGVVSLGPIRCGAY